MTKKQNALFFIFFLAASLFSQTEIILQEGFNGYSGFQEGTYANNSVPDDGFLGAFHYTC